MNFSEVWYYFLIMAAVSYLIGCINFALLISRVRHKDVRQLGSGNPGTMNMTRNFGVGVGLITLILDMCKGGIPSLIAYLLFKDVQFAGTSIYIADITRYLCGFFVIIGHIYPITMHFRGGKGIGSSLGIFWFSLTCEAWYYFFIVLAVLLITLWFIVRFEYGSTGSLLSVTTLACLQAVIFFFRYQSMLLNPYVIFCFACLLFICYVTWFAHSKNIMQMFAGEEHKTSIKKIIKRMKEKKLKKQASGE